MGMSECEYVLCAWDVFKVIIKRKNKEPRKDCKDCKGAELEKKFLTFLEHIRENCVSPFVLSH